MTETKKTIKSFRDLEVYQNTYEVMKTVASEVLPKLPSREKFDLIDQLSRSSKAIPRLIAEGYAKRHQKAGFQKYLDDAMGESNETIVSLEQARDLYNLDKELIDGLVDMYDKSSRQLYKLSMSWTAFKTKDAKPYEHRNRNRAGGFTLVEILVVIAVIVVIGAIIFGAFSRYRRNQAVDTSSRIVLSALQEARQNTLDSLNSSQYGIHFSSSTVSVFKGASLSSGSIEDEFDVPPPVEIDEISISGGSEVLFERLTGATANTGYVIIREPGSEVPFKKIIVEKTGLAYVE